MDTLTIREGLIVLLIERGDVDATNAIPLLRWAEERVRRYLDERGEYGTSLSYPFDGDYVDSLLIRVSENGGIDLFSRPE